jgi:hypothetical protein
MADPETNLMGEARRRAQKVHIDPQIMRDALLAQRRGRPFVVELEAAGGATFYRCVDEGESRILYLNIGHSFFTDVYMGPGSTPEFRAGMEVFLWVLGNAEADADPVVAKRYAQERAEWSRRLASALGELRKMFPIEDWNDEEWQDI